jgi:uncharacterized protein YidB (DUF937 family)
MVGEGLFGPARFLSVEAHGIDSALGSDVLRRLANEAGSNVMRRYLLMLLRKKSAAQA